MCSNLLARETQTILLCEHRMITAEPFSLQQPAEFPSMQHFGSKHVPEVKLLLEFFYIFLHVEKRGFALFYREMSMLFTEVF